MPKPLLLADPATHPLTYHYQLRTIEHRLPDAVTDTIRKRQRGARSLLGDGAGIMCRLLAVPRSDLYHLVIHLPIKMDLYNDVPTAGRRVLKDVLGKLPYWAVAASGRKMRPHLHVIVAIPLNHKPPCQCEFGSIYAKAVYDVVGLALYLSKPYLEGASDPTPGDLKIWSKENLWQQRLDASEYYLKSKLNRSTRLPRLSWTANLPRLKPDKPNWVAVWKANMCLKVRQSAPYPTSLKLPVHQEPSPALQQVVIAAINHYWIRAPPAKRSKQSNATAPAPDHQDRRPPPHHTTLMTSPGRSVGQSPSSLLI